RARIRRARGIGGKPGANRVDEGGDRGRRREGHGSGDAPPLFRPFIVPRPGLELRSLPEPAELAFEKTSVRGPLRHWNGRNRGGARRRSLRGGSRSEEHTSELQSR